MHFSKSNKKSCIIDIIIFNNVMLIELPRGKDFLNIIISYNNLICNIDY